MISPVGNTPGGHHMSSAIAVLVDWVPEPRGQPAAKVWPPAMPDSDRPSSLLVHCPFQVLPVDPA